MEFRFLLPEIRRIDDSSAEAAVCTYFCDERPLAGFAAILDWRLAGRLSRLQKIEYVRGELGEVLCVPGRPRVPYDMVLLVGLGPRAEFDADRFRFVLGKIKEALDGFSARQVVIELPGRYDGALDAEEAHDIAREIVGESPLQDVWWLVESHEASRHITQREEQEKLRQRSVVVS